MRWFLSVENGPNASQHLAGGWAVISAARRDGLIGVVDDDGFAMQLLHLREQNMVWFEHYELTTDQGHELFRAQPSAQLQQALSFHSLPDGQRWVTEPAAGPTFNIQGSNVGQIAGRDINNLTLLQLVDALEQAIPSAPGSETAKAEVSGWLRRFRTALHSGGEVAHDTAVSVLVEIISRQLKIPPG